MWWLAWQPQSPKVFPSCGKRLPIGELLLAYAETRLTVRSTVHAETLLALRLSAAGRKAATLRCTLGAGSKKGTLATHSAHGIAAATRAVRMGDVGGWRSGGSPERMASWRNLHSEGANERQVRRFGRRPDSPKARLQCIDWTPWVLAVLLGHSARVGWLAWSGFGAPFMGKFPHSE